MDDFKKSRSAFVSPVHTESIVVADVLKEQDTDKLGGRNFLLEKIKNSLRERRSGLTSIKSKKDILEDIRSSEIKSLCPEHPDEEFQFYSFTNDKPLCSECVLSGAYTGCEVLSLKKAVDRIKPKLTDLVQEINMKVEQLEGLGDQNEIKAETFYSLYKAQIIEKFNELRATIDRKEKEILEKVEKIEKEKQKDPELKSQNTKDLIEQLLGLKESIVLKTSTLKEVDLCHFYASKINLIRTYMNDDITPRMKESNEDIYIEHPKDQYTLTEYLEEMNKIIYRVSNLRGLELRSLKSELDRVTNQIDKERQEINQENFGLIKKISNFSDEISDISSRPRSVSPFRTLKKELESISPMPITIKELDTPGTTTENTLKRLFEKAEEKRKVLHAPKERELKRDIKSQSIAKLSLVDTNIQHLSRRNNFDASNEKDATKKFWDTYKEIIEDQAGRKHTFRSPLKKTEEFERRTTPKSFIPDFNRQKLGIGIDALTSSRRDLFSSPSKETISTKNSRQEDPSKPTHGALRLQHKRNDGAFFALNSNNCKSFGAGSLTTNLKKLKIEMGLHNDE